MTEPSTDTTEPAAAPSVSDAAVAGYRRAMQRQGRIYYLILLAVVVAIGVGVSIAWTHGEVAHTSLHTVSTVPPTLPLEAPARTLTEAWHAAGEQAAIGAPQARGTVVTFSRHTVGGRSARTGARTWSYTRSDRTVCTAAQFPGTPDTTIAVYELHGNCDEVTALDSQTGRRRWTRTLDMDGMPVNGIPDFQSLPYTLMVTTPAIIYALDPVTGYDRWTYQRTGCRIEHAVLGTAGVLISQDCTAHVECGILKYCGKGRQLLLRDRDATNGDSAKANADQIKWIKLGDRDVPASADQLLSAYLPGGRQLDVLDPDGGATTRVLQLEAAVAADASVGTGALSAAELVWVSGRVYVVGADDAAPHWVASSTGPPTVSTSGDSPPGYSDARIVVPTPSGIAEIDGLSGSLQPATGARVPAPGSLVYPLGSGYLVTGAGGIVAYR